MSGTKNTPKKWWEKTVEYKFVRDYINWDIKPLSGNEERAGDAFLNNNNRFILIEFKSENSKDNIKSEFKKYLSLSFNNKELNNTVRRFIYDSLLDNTINDFCNWLSKQKDIEKGKEFENIQKHIKNQNNDMLLCEINEKMNNTRKDIDKIIEHKDGKCHFIIAGKMEQEKFSLVANWYKCFLQNKFSYDNNQQEYIKNLYLYGIEQKPYLEYVDFIISLKIGNGDLSSASDWFDNIISVGIDKNNCINNIIEFKEILMSDTYHKHILEMENNIQSQIEGRKQECIQQILNYLQKKEELSQNMKELTEFLDRLENDSQKLDDEDNELDDEDNELIENIKENIETWLDKKFEKLKYSSSPKLGR